MCDPNARSQSGFTLVEVLVALGVLMFGVVSLIGVLGVGVGERRGAEQRMRAAMLADHVLGRIEQEFLAQNPVTGQEETVEELEIDAIEPQLADDYAGLEYTIRFSPAAEFRELILVTVTVSWLDEGATLGQKFQRVLSRHVPFSQRVAKRRKS